MDDPEFRIISLGTTCRTKYQILRNEYFQRNPRGDIEQFRRAVFDPKLRDYSFDTHIFDWQITPVESICNYIDRDFVDIFDKTDLELTGDVNYVRNRRFDTFHPHLFHPSDGIMTAKLLDEQFEAAKNKMEWLANKFRALLRSGDNVVYILWYTTPPNASQLIDLLLKKSTGKFHILLTGLEPLDSAVFGNVASSFIMPETVGKAIERQWEGDDNDWDRLFDILRGPSHPSP